MIEKLKNLWHRTVVRVLAILTGAALILGALSGCGASDSDCQGDPGKVVEKDYDKAGKHSSADYDLTIQRSNPEDIRKADGRTEYEKDVTSTAFNDWYKNGSKFPSSKHCNSDGTAK